MMQYCRYCSSLSVGDSCYCEIRRECLSEEACKKVNRCNFFCFNEIDAFNPEKTYRPRAIKKTLYQQLKLDI